MHYGSMANIRRMTEYRDNPGQTATSIDLNGSEITCSVYEPLHGSSDRIERARR
jgi:hypothetical protein